MTDTKETRSDRFDPTQDVRSTARTEAASVTDDAKQAGGRVAQTAKEGASRVADETKSQARRLASQATEELREQAAEQQQRVAAGLRSAGDELRTMAEASSGQSVASEAVQQAAQRATSVAAWLENRDPGSLLEEVKRFARRRPAPFIAIAIGTGIVAGRLTRALAESSASEASGPSGQHAAGGSPTVTSPNSGSASMGSWSAGTASGGSVPTGQAGADTTMGLP